MPLELSGMAGRLVDVVGFSGKMAAIALSRSAGCGSSQSSAKRAHT